MSLLASERPQHEGENRNENTDLNRGTDKGGELVDELLDRPLDEARKQPDEHQECDETTEGTQKPLRGTEKKLSELFHILSLALLAKRLLLLFGAIITTPLNRTVSTAGLGNRLAPDFQKHLGGLDDPHQNFFLLHITPSPLSGFCGLI